METKKILNQIKSKFIIGLIKFKNIVGEHKYISSICFLFLASAIIALVVFAEDDPYKGKISTTISTTSENLVIKNLDGNNVSKEEVNSFDTVILDINYLLSLNASDAPTDTVLRDVYIEASIDGKNIDAYWYQGPSNDDGNYSYDVEKNKLSATVFDKGLGKNNQLLYLKVNNIANGTEIPVTVNIRDNGKDEFATQKYSLKVKSELASISAKMIAGSSYKSSEFNGRYSPYGILLGINGEKLTGKYFDPNAKIIMEATSNNLPADISTSEELFGTYVASSNLLKLPNHEYDGTVFSVFNSGSVTGLKKLTGGSNVVSTSTVNTESLYLLGDKKVTLELGKEEYKESGISLSENGSALTSSSYTVTVYNSNGDKISKIDNTKAGNYKIAYTYKGDGFTSTIYRDIEVVENRENILSSGEYSLNGFANINIAKGSKYNELGVLKGSTKYNAQSITYFNSSNTEITSIDTASSGTYYVTYTVTENDILKRTVNVVDNLGSISSPTFSVDSNYSCVDKCSLEYFDSSNRKIDDISTAPAGEYIATYTITSDDYKIVVSRKLQIGTTLQYELNITGIKTDGIYYKDGNFIALGSYFVNVESKRESDNTGDLPVSLKITKINDNTSDISANSTNPNVSVGTKNSSLTFYGYDSSNNLVEDSSATYLAYGEDVVLSSKFSYSKDADNNISELIVKVPINNFSDSLLEPAFSVVDYSGDTDNIHPYEITEEYADNVSVNYYYSDGESDTTLDFDKTVSYIEYTLKNLKPGSDVDFRVKLNVNAVNHNKNVKLKDASYKINGVATNITNPSINITAFKARTKIYANDIEQDEITIDGSRSTIWQIYPSVSMPAATINTNIAGISNLTDLTITVTLPNGVNYVFNEDFDAPILSNNNKTLVYKIDGKKINDWFEPISFETNYDIGLKNGAEYEISVLIDATSDGISDISSKELRTTKAKIIYQNSNDVRYNLGTSSSAVTKDQSFDVTYSIYNNSGSSMYGTVLVLPYNDKSNTDKKGYTGTYEISDIPAEAYCTTSEAGLLINNSDSLLEDVNGIEWKPCSEYAGNSYSDVTALKIDNINIPQSQIFEKTIKIVPRGNKTDDNYEFNGYLYDKNTNNKISKKVTVSVISKKITGIVWEDFDEDGIMTSEEKRISGVVLKLYDAQTNEELEDKRVISNDNGEYTISDIQPGKYYIMAEYNTSKYGITNSRSDVDKSVRSAFKPSSGTVDTGEDKNVDSSDDSGDNTDDDSDENAGDDSEENTDDNETDDSDDKEVVISPASVKTDVIEVTNSTRIIKNINLGLTIKKLYTVKLSKYITRAVTTNGLGISTTKEYGNVSLAKLDVKDLTNLSVKVVYTIELENTGYYPGYIYAVKDYIPDGMTFNPSYEENKGWIVNDDGYVENNTLSDQLIYGGDKKYLTIAFEVTRKEAGSFVNYSEVSDDDLQRLMLDDLKKDSSLSESEGGNNEY